MSKKFIYCILISVLFLVIILGLLFVNSNNKNDAKKFKEEYESLNSKYYKLSIDKKNPFIYLSSSKALDYLDKNTFILYIGNAKDNNSRKIVEMLLDEAKNNGVSKIYYLVANNIAKADYNKLVKKIESEFIVVPTIIFASSGEIVNHFSYLDFENEQELKQNINYYMQKIFNDFCDEECDD